MALPTGLRKRGSVYYSQFKDPATGTWRSKAVGRDLASALERHATLRRLIKVRADAEPEGLSLEELGEAWIQRQRVRCRPRTVQICLQRLGVLKRFFGPISVARITLSKVDAFVEARRSDGLRDLSINAELGALRQLLRYGVSAGLLEQPPVNVRLLRTVRKTRRSTLDRRQVRDLIAAVDQWPGSDHVKDKLRVFIMLGLATGMRSSEILHLQWRDVDLRSGRVELRAKRWKERRYCRISRRVVSREREWAPKTHQERSVWIGSKDVLSELARYRGTLQNREDGGWVFQGKQPGLRLTTLARPLRECFKWAGSYQRGKTAHLLRHTAATELLANGVDLETVRDVLGHNDVTTTALYLHTSDERKAKAAKRLQLV